MNLEIDDTTSAHLESWVSSANDPACDFPIQNLPFGRFQMAGSDPWKVGVAIGTQIVDVAAAGLDVKCMEDVLALPSPKRRRLRQELSQALRVNGGAHRRRLERALVPMQDATLGVPCTIRNFSDFFAGIHHARQAGQLLRPGSSLRPNYHWVPIAYHGRASTIQASGRDILRPMGQVLDARSSTPYLAPTRKLDFELELGVITGMGNAAGFPIPIDSAEEHIFGLTLLNDWSARDIQSWEAQPLGPFLAKSFATSISPWIVTLEALEPFRQPFVRPDDAPQPLPYLDRADHPKRGAVDIQLEARLQTQAMREHGLPGERIVKTNYADAAYWTMAQMVAHQTINGCALLAGDLLGTGTLSGIEKEQQACLLEVTANGSEPLHLLSTGETRAFLQDGDTVTLTGFCEREGYRRIGFGQCSATVRPAIQKMLENALPHHS